MVSVLKALAAADWKVVVAAIAILFTAQAAIRRVYFHPLSKYPGPKLAAATTLWHAVVEWILGHSFLAVLEGLHAQYGEVVRIGPNELHFANPAAYDDIYNNRCRWDKELRLYHSFGEDRSSFGYLTYAEAKPRKDVLSKTFSARAVYEAEPIIQQKVDALCEALRLESLANRAVDLTYALRCIPMDVITYLAFGKSIDAIWQPGFRAPIILAMDAAVETFVGFKHAEWFKLMITKCPPKLSKILSPATAGLVDLQQILKKQINDIAVDNSRLEELPHKMTIYHSLLDPDSRKQETAPDAESIYEEAQALMFGGADTVGNTLVMTFFQLLKNEEKFAKLRAEVQTAWPSLEQKLCAREIERLPYLNAVLREGLRLSLGIAAGLLRVVPPAGANIADNAIPGGTIVSCASKFVHYAPEIFPSPEAFRPERWLENPELDNSLVAFSKGPRACIGINLAWTEMRLTLANLTRRFDVKLDDSSPERLEMVDRFLPSFVGPHVSAHLTPVRA